MTERCELCAVPIADEHPHLFAHPQRTLLCACAACAALFGLLDGGRYRRVQPAARRLPHLQLDEASWTALGIPVGLAFVSRAAGGDVVAAFPGPAGAATAPVSREAWDAVLARYPDLADLEPDVEAWLVNRLAAEARHYRVSIDHCYRLAGLVRSRWRGLGGGPGVREAIVEFFEELEAQAA